MSKDEREKYYLKAVKKACSTPQTEKRTEIWL